MIFSDPVSVAQEGSTSLSVDFDATGTNANGQKVFSNVKTVTVPF
jgi:hypothetical protein